MRSFFFFCCLSVGRIGVETVLDFLLPFITICQQFLLIVKQFLSGFRGVLDIGGLDNGIDRAGLLAVAAVDALGHINIVLGGTSRTINPLFSLNGDGHSRANGFTQLTGNAALLTTGVAAKGMLTSESRRNRTLLKGVVDRVGRAEELLEHNVHTTEHFSQQKELGGLVEGSLVRLVPGGRAVQAEAGGRDGLSGSRGEGCE